MRVLLIDDQADVLATIGAALRHAGHQVVATRSAAAALRRIRSDAFDALIADVPIDLIKRLRRRRPDLWIVAMSAGRKTMSASLYLKLAEAFGVDRVLYKPFREVELLAALAGGPAGAPTG